MTCTEFSNEFDILLNSYSDNPSDIKIDEYEKSIYLTQAQEEIIKNLYSGTNKYMEGFEATEKLRRYLDTLNKSEYFCVYLIRTAIYCLHISIFSNFDCI